MIGRYAMPKGDVAWPQDVPPMGVPGGGTR
jgi:hypothetical protein